MSTIVTRTFRITSTSTHLDEFAKRTPRQRGFTIIAGMIDPEPSSCITAGEAVQLLEKLGQQMEEAEGGQK